MNRALMSLSMRVSSRLLNFWIRWKRNKKQRRQKDRLKASKWPHLVTCIDIERQSRMWLARPPLTKYFNQSNLKSLSCLLSFSKLWTNVKQLKIWYSRLTSNSLITICRVISKIPVRKIWWLTLQTSKHLKLCIEEQPPTPQWRRARVPKQASNKIQIKTNRISNELKVKSAC